MPVQLDKEQYSKADVEELLRQEREETDEQLTVAKAIAEMNEAERTHYRTLDDVAKSAYILMSTDERAAEIKKLEDADPVVYTATDGTEYRKSAGEALIAMAKGRDEDRKKIDELAKSNDDARLEKLADTEYQYLPGTTDTRVAIIKAAEAITDPEQRQAALDALKAQNAQMFKAFEEFGTSEALKEAATGNEAHQQLEKHAEDLRKADPSLSEADAYEKAGEQHPDLYTKAVNG